MNAAAPDFTNQPQPRARVAIVGGGLQSEIRGTTRRDSVVGVRPVRDSVCFEADAARPRLIHGDGHDGAGMTRSWGLVNLAAPSTRDGLVGAVT